MSNATDANVIRLRSIRPKLMKSFEIEVVNALLREAGISLVPSDVVADAVDYSGTGYFLSLRNSRFSKERIVLGSPDIRGKLGRKNVGFIGFIENSELTLECYSYEDTIVSSDRDEVFKRNIVE